MHSIDKFTEVEELECDAAHPVNCGLGTLGEERGQGEVTCSVSDLVWWGLLSDHEESKEDPGEVERAK